MVGVHQGMNLSSSCSSSLVLMVTHYHVIHSRSVYLSVLKARSWLHVLTVVRMGWTRSRTRDQLTVGLVLVLVMVVTNLVDTVGVMRSSCSGHRTVHSGLRTTITQFLITDKLNVSYLGIINEVFLDGLKKPQKPMLFEALEPKTTSTYSIWCGSRRQQW